MLSKLTTDQIRKEAELYMERYKGSDAPITVKNTLQWCYEDGATAWAVWKEKAEGYEKALKEICRIHNYCRSKGNKFLSLYEMEALEFHEAYEALESFNQNKVK